MAMNIAITNIVKEIVSTNVMMSCFSGEIPMKVRMIRAEHLHSHASRDKGPHRRRNPGDGNTRSNASPGIGTTRPIRTAWVI